MTCQEFTRLCRDLRDGEIVRLSGEEVFDIWSDDCLCVEGYHFSNTASAQENPAGTRPVLVYMKGKKNVVLDGNGAKIVVHGIMTPFLFDACENLVFRNFTIDYARPTMSEFTVLENDGRGTCLILIAKDSLYEVRKGRLVWVGERGKNGIPLWEHDLRDGMNLAMYRNPQTERVYAMGREKGMRFPCVPSFRVLRDEGDGRLTVRLDDPSAFFPVGCTVQIRSTVRDQIGGAFVYCRDVRCENLTVHAMHGLGLVAQFCENIAFSGLQIHPSVGRTNACNADFFQISGCSGKVVLENSSASYGHDDFVNVHGTHFLITEKEGRTLKARFMEPHSRGFVAFFVGDEIGFIDKNTLLPYGSARVARVEMLGDVDFLLETEEENNAVCGDAIENVTRTPEVYIRNNRFGPSMGRGILCLTRRKAVVENNLFYKTGGSVLCIEDDCNFWYESGCVTDLVFRNNTVIGCGYGCFGDGNVPVISVNPQVLDRKSPVYVHKKISVTGNVFRDLPENSYVIDVKNAERFEFTGNRSDREFGFRTESVKELVVDRQREEL